MVHAHPYHPPHVELHGFVPMTVGFDYVLGVFAIACLTVGLGTWAVSGRYKKTITKLDRLLACWFMITGLIHFIVEGYVVVKADFYRDTTGHYLSETWKEYSKADSRYATRDSFIIAMEAITAFVWGPLCPVVVYGIFNSKPWRYTLMIMVSLGQIYGDVLYYGTCYLEEFVHSRPEWLYFWVYFVAVNSLWILIPGLVIAHAYKQISKAVGNNVGKTKRR